MILRPKFNMLQDKTMKTHGTLNLALHLDCLVIKRDLCATVVCRTVEYTGDNKQKQLYHQKQQQRQFHH